MLTITIDGMEYFDDETEMFSYPEQMVLSFEHSLVSLSKWESEFQKPFLGTTEKTAEEVVSYICHMLLTPEIDKKVIYELEQKDLDKITDYIESPESATTFGTMPKQTGRGETITSELIYYWMVTFTIPFDCETWHLNRLFSLIKICNLKNQPSKKRPRQEIAAENRRLNEERKKQLETKG